MIVQSLVLRHGAGAWPLGFAVVREVPDGAILGAWEAAQLAGFVFPAKREGFLLGRAAAKHALAALLDEPDHRRIEIRSGVHGQPLVHHPRADRAHVSISHSQGVAVAIAHPPAYPMGIDLESVAPEAAGTILAELAMSAAERAWLAAVDLDAATACGVLWTAREALGKALRTGLNSPLGVFALDGLEQAGPAAWIGRYGNFPHSQCLSQAVGKRVLTLALPAEAQLGAWPRLSNP